MCADPRCFGETGFDSGFDGRTVGIIGGTIIGASEVIGGASDVECVESAVVRVRHQPQTGLHTTSPQPPWRQPRGKLMVDSVNSYTNANRIGWHLCEIDLRFAPGVPPGWRGRKSSFSISLICTTRCRIPTSTSTD